MPGNKRWKVSEDAPHINPPQTQHNTTQHNTIQHQPGRTLCLQCCGRDCGSNDSRGETRTRWFARAPRSASRRAARLVACVSTTRATRGPVPCCCHAQEQWCNPAASSTAPHRHRHSPLFSCARLCMARCGTQCQPTPLAPAPLGATLAAVHTQATQLAQQPPRSQHAAFLHPLHLPFCCC